jgi:hypothetical protein
MNGFFLIFSPMLSIGTCLPPQIFYPKVTKIVGATLRKVTFSFFPLEFFSPLACYYSNILSVFHQNEIKKLWFKSQFIFAFSVIFFYFLRYFVYL